MLQSAQGVSTPWHLLRPLGETWLRTTVLTKNSLCCFLQRKCTTEEITELAWKAASATEL